MLLIQPNIPSVTLTKSAGQSLLGVISKARGMLTHTTNIDSCSSGHLAPVCCAMIRCLQGWIHLPFYVHCDPWAHPWPRPSPWPGRIHFIMSWIKLWYEGSHHPDTCSLGLWEDEVWCGLDLKSSGRSLNTHTGACLLSPRGSHIRAPPFPSSAKDVGVSCLVWAPLGLFWKSTFRLLSLTAVLSASLCHSDMISEGRLLLMA